MKKTKHTYTVNFCGELHAGSGEDAADFVDELVYLAHKLRRSAKYEEAFNTRRKL